MSLTSLFYHVHRGVVQLLSEDGDTLSPVGTGSVILKENLILTCAHCVPCDVRLFARNAAEDVVCSTTTVFRSDPLDIAMLKTRKSIGCRVPLGNSELGCPGDRVFTIGFPLSVTEHTLVAGHIASVTDDYFRVAASFNAGNSGGPLFNSDGEQIGVVNAKMAWISKYLDDLQRTSETGNLIIGDVDPVKAIIQLIRQMETNLNVGLGLAIPSHRLRGLHPGLDNGLLF